MQEEYHQKGFAIVKGVFTIEKSIDLNIWRALANIAFADRKAWGFIFMRRTAS